MVGRCAKLQIRLHKLTVSPSARGYQDHRRKLGYASAEPFGGDERPIHHESA